MRSSKAELDQPYTNSTYYQESVVNEGIGQGLLEHVSVPGSRDVAVVGDNGSELVEKPFVLQGERPVVDIEISGPSGGVGENGGYSKNDGGDFFNPPHTEPRGSGSDLSQGPPPIGYVENPWFSEKNMEDRVRTARDIKTIARKVAFSKILCSAGMAKSAFFDGMAFFSTSSSNNDLDKVVHKSADDIWSVKADENGHPTIHRHLTTELV